MDNTQKIQNLVRQINNTLSYIQERQGDCLIEFLGENGVLIHDINFALSEQNRLSAKILTDRLRYAQDTQSIRVTVSSKSGYERIFELKKEPPQAEPQTVRTPGGGGMGLGALLGLGGMDVEQNPGALGFILAQQQSQTQIEQTRRDYERQMADMEREHEREKGYLKDQITDKKHQIEKIGDELADLKKELKETADKLAKLEAQKQSFDNQKIMADIGTKLGGTLLLMMNRGKEDQMTEVFQQAGLGLIMGENSKMLLDPESQTPKTTEPEYTEEETKRIKLLRSVGIFDYAPHDFSLIYTLLKMVVDDNNVFAGEILPVMVRKGYAQMPQTQNQAPKTEQHGEAVVIPFNPQNTPQTYPPQAEYDDEEE